MNDERIRVNIKFGSVRLVPLGLEEEEFVDKSTGEIVKRQFRRTKKIVCDGSGMVESEQVLPPCIYLESREKPKRSLLERVLGRAA